MSGAFNNLQEPQPLAKRDAAMILYMMVVQYENNLSPAEFQIAFTRLKYQFENFEQWLRSQGYYFKD